MVNFSSNLDFVQICQKSGRSLDLNRTMGKWLDDNFVFYASYHDHSVNQWIHIICVPLLILSGLVMLSFTPALMEGSLDIKGSLPVLVGQFLPADNIYSYNFAFVFAALYCAYYAVIELPGIAGLIASKLVFWGYVYATHLYTTQGNAIWNTALYTHIICWVAQFVGHGVWEGMKCMI